MKTFARTFRAVLTNDLVRAKAQSVGIVIYMLATLVSMALGLYLNETQQVKARIVYVAQDAVQAPSSSAELDVTVEATEPPESLLVKQRYDAYVIPQPDGSINVVTLHSDDFKAAVTALVADPSLSIGLGQTTTGPGCQIIGFMMMFLLMNAFGSLFVFSQDKEEGQLVRVSVAPTSFPGYLFAHCVYCLLGIIPEFLLLAVFQALGHDIGFTLPEYLALMVMLDLLGIACALLLHTLIGKRDNANMLGNSLIMLTSLLAGSFSLAVRHAPVVDALRDLLPQKRLMDFASALEAGVPANQAASLLYALGFVAVLFVVSCAILRRRYVRGA